MSFVLYYTVNNIVIHFNCIRNVTKRLPKKKKKTMTFSFSIDIPIYIHILIIYYYIVRKYTYSECN